MPSQPTFRGRESAPEVVIAVIDLLAFVVIAALVGVFIGSLI